jgi:alcohol dehydrogenase (cytochrome c)
VARALTAALAWAWLVVAASAPSASLRAQPFESAQGREPARPATVDATRLFEAQCATCHGADGRGTERGPDIITGRGASRSLDETVRIIREGIPSGGMPRSALPSSHVAAIAGHVRTLAERAREPRSFRRMAVTLREGRKLEGLVQNESINDLQLLTTDGTLVALTRAEIASTADLGHDVMPHLTPREIDDRWTADDWPTYNGSASGNRHSGLAQIKPANVGNLRLRWTFPVGNARGLRTTPLVVDGIMYVTAPNELYALDARNGRAIWQYSRPRTAGVIGDAGAGVNRGVAVRGDRVFMVTDHAHLIALHRANGQLLWDIAMADYREHYGATGAPLIVGNLVISGVSGGDEGIRGFVAAFDAATGKEAWRFWTVPARGEPGSETWKGKAIEHPCAATWLTGSYDPALNLLFWTTGNPCPDYNGAERIGDNLWSNAVLALEPATGKLRWHYQFTPHDLNDWDAVQTVVAVDAMFKGEKRQLLLQANRNGFFYVLDRATGKVLLAKPFVTKMNWASGIGSDGRPQRLPGLEPSIKGTVVCPSVAGATNWMSPAFNPETGLYYVMALERCNLFRKSAVWFQRGESFYGGATENVPGEPGRKYVRAIDIQTGAIAWEHEHLGPGNTWGGLLSTTTGLVFFADDGGAFSAADARTGKLLWSFPANATWRGSPMAYAVRGEQFIAIAAGGTILAFGL